MELGLNLAWMLLAALMCVFWVSYAPPKRSDKRAQFVALALVLLILFPVISVTDDYAMAQNPAETDTLQRKGNAAEYAHAILHSVADRMLQAIVEPASEFSLLIQQGYEPALKALAPAMGPIQNRPPPAA